MYVLACIVVFIMIVECAFFYFPLLAMATMYVRYKLVQAFNNHDIPLRRLNQIALFFGTCSSLGVSLVANFQVR